MNKRDFKKSVQFVGDTACADMVDIFESNENVDKEKVANAIEKVIAAVAAAKTNADITFDKGVRAFNSIQEYSKAKKGFFKQLFAKIKEDFSKELEVAVKEFNAALPEEVKNQNKESATN